MTPLKIAIAGVNGRMGRVLVEAVNNHPDTVLSGALEHSGSEALGLDAGYAVGLKTGITISDDVDTVLAQSDVLIDFTRPEPTLKHLQKCVEKGVCIIIGTTGFDDAGKAAIQAAGEKTGVVFAANFSVGVNLTFHILDTVARVLNEGYDIEIIEGHHRHKVVEITHKASSRMTFAAGAVRAAVWVNDKTGLYDMQDVLGLNNR